MINIYHCYHKHIINRSLIFFRIDWDNLIFKSESFCPQVDFIADYKLDGKILLIPLRGEGRCNISMRKYYNIFS